MKGTSLASIKPLENTQFWLLAIAGGLVAVYVSLYLKLYGSINQVSICLLGLFAVSSLLAEKRHTLKFESDIFSTLVGTLLIAFVLVRALSVSSIDFFVELSPFIGLFGIALIASGFKGLRQYWLELLLIFAFNAPIGFIGQRFDISIFTALFSHAILSYLGFPVVREGVNIIMPTGAVEVYPGCSGIETITQLIKLAILFLIMFPVSVAKRFLVPFVAIVIGFVVNGVRVALMAFLVARSTPAAFTYWHTGTGSQIFFLICSLMFGGFCYLISKNDKDDSQEPMELSS